MVQMVQARVHSVKWVTMVFTSGACTERRCVYVPHTQHSSEGGGNGVELESPHIGPPGRSPVPLRHLWGPVLN